MGMCLQADDDSDDDDGDDGDDDDGDGANTVLPLSFLKVICTSHGRLRSADP